MKVKKLLIVLAIVFFAFEIVRFTAHTIEQANMAYATYQAKINAATNGH